MKIQIVLPEPIPITEQLIMADNVQIGTVKIVTDSPSYKYHVILKSSVNNNLYQGFGMTMDEAMRDSITKNKNIRQLELSELEQLENVIWGDHELHQ